jgi:hypothetical protein
MDMSVSDILKRAAAEVESAGLPDDLRATGFAKAVDLLVAAAEDIPSPAARSPNGAPGDPYGEVAQALGIDVHAVTEVFEIVDGNAHVIVAPSRLPQQKAAAMRDVALLISTVRQTSGIDESWTATDVIRDECRALGVFDSANFASEISGLGALFSFKGTGRARLIRVNRRGYEQAGQRIAVLAELA